MVKKKFNKDQFKTVVDNKEQNKINLDTNDNDYNQYDDANVLVLPSQKRKTKKVHISKTPVKLLSKKHRKRLQKIVDKKNLKSKRAHLIEDLQNYRATPKQTEELASIQAVQSVGYKKFTDPSFTCVNISKNENRDDSVISMKWKLSKAVKRELKKNAEKQPPPKKVKSYNVVQSDYSSSSDESDTNEQKPEKTEAEATDTETVDETPNEGSGEEVIDVSDEPKEAEEEIEVVEETNDEAIESTPKAIEVETILPGPARMKKTFKRVQRDAGAQRKRLHLPILAEEQVVMEAINENGISIVVGPTGSGKTTQVPQFLYEAGYSCNGKLIGITEPRRVAAVSMADRVGKELGLPPEVVSYQIRFEGTTTNKTEIKFMTDGVLFKELLKDHLLRKYSVIVIDEAHERSVHSDILIGLLSRIVPKRNSEGTSNPLRLVIMSATLRIEDFTQNITLFKETIPPVVKVDSRMFDVNIYFNKMTDVDYCAAAYRKICKIHRQLPEGGILVFLTGQHEIIELCRYLKRTFPMEGSKYDLAFQQTAKEKQKLKQMKARDKAWRKSLEKKTPLKLQDFETPVEEKSTVGDKLSNPLVDEYDPLDDEDMMPEMEEDSEKKSTIKEQPIFVLPLYSVLPGFKQQMVFQPPPEGTRLCVVATNVAETSLTIPDIKYVIDSGRTKDKVYDPVTGVSSYKVQLISKASADQRAGRAGRTCEGYCYRLYSSALYKDEFEQYAVPDIRKRPLDDVVLTMKALKIPVFKFPFPTPPEPEHLEFSFKRLINLGALEEKTTLTEGKNTDSTMITEVGLSLSTLPIAPRFAKMLLYSHQHEGILPYVIILIASLSVQELLVEVSYKSTTLTEVQRKWLSLRSKWSGSNASHLLGDLLVFINAVLEGEKNNNSFHWCKNSGIRHSALSEVRKLRRQLTNEINLLIPEIDLMLEPNMKLPTDKQACIIAEVMLMGSLEHVACRVDLPSLQMLDDETRTKWKNAYRSVYTQRPLHISTSSTMYKDRPKYVMYQDILETSKIFIRVISVIDEAWLLQHGGSLVTMSPPLESPQPRYDADKDAIMCHREGTYGPEAWKLEKCEVPYPFDKDLFKWAAYFFLDGQLWPKLNQYKSLLHNYKVILSPFTFRFKEKREKLISALTSKEVSSAKALEKVWKEEPDFLKHEYFSWFVNQEDFTYKVSKWPPIKEEDAYLI